MPLPSGCSVEITYIIEKDMLSDPYVMSESDTNDGYFLPEEALFKEYNGIPIEWYLDPSYTIKAEPLMDVVDYINDSFAVFHLMLYGKYVDIKKYLDFEGVKYLWSKVYEQDRSNFKDLINHMNRNTASVVRYDQQELTKEQKE
jgi:hypothetical protein